MRSIVLVALSVCVSQALSIPVTNGMDNKLYLQSSLRESCRRPCSGMHAAFQVSALPRITVQTTQLCSSRPKHCRTRLPHKSFQNRRIKLTMQMSKERELQESYPAGTTTAALRPSSLAKLALFGALLGPAVDAIHNQVLLKYDILPISIINAKTSLLIPPLLAFAYVVLGGALPPLVRKLAGVGRIREPLLSLNSGPRAAAAVVSTAAIIRLSVELAAMPPAIGLPALSLAALIQWIALDATWASLVLGIAAGIGGPIAEIPLMLGGCWHYLAPDYFPLHSLGINDAVGGLSALTGPCYFAVTTDSIALGKWFETHTTGDVEAGSE